MSVIRCILGDGSEVFGEGLRAVLDRTGEVTVLARVSDPVVLPRAVADLKPDVVVASYEPISEAVTAATEQMCAPMIVLAWSKHSEDLLNAMRSGARGFLHKDVSLDDLMRGLKDVVAGRTAYPLGAERMLVDLIDGRAAVTRRRADYRSLTTREREIVQLVVEGYANKAVAAALGIAEQTAKNHIRHVMVKLSLSSRTQLCAWAVDHGYVRRQSTGS